MQSAIDPVSTRVVEAVARSKGVDFTALPSLYDTIDPDALDALFSRRSNGTTRDENGLSVKFAYAGREVVIESNGDVDVRRQLAEVGESLHE